MLSGISISRRSESFSAESTRQRVVGTCVQRVLGMHDRMKEFMSDLLREWRCWDPEVRWAGDGCGPTSLVGLIKSGLSLTLESMLSSKEVKLLYRLEAS